MADEDANFDIDLYGDDEMPPTPIPAKPSSTPQSQIQTQVQPAEPQDSQMQEDAPSEGLAAPSTAQLPRLPQAPVKPSIAQQHSASTAATSTTAAAEMPLAPLPNGASSALVVLDLPWYTTEDDLRAWAYESGCEEDLNGLTFNEHKVNGKSKGQVYLEFGSAQSAVTYKAKVESLAAGPQGDKRYVVNFASPTVNPYHTLPKDQQSRQATRGSAAPFNNTRGGFQETSFRGGRGGMNRGGVANGVQYGRGGFQQPQQSMGGFAGNSQLGGFGGFKNGFNNNFNNNANRGGMTMNVRGGHNAASAAMNMMPMSMMPGMAMGMNMGMIPNMNAFGGVQGHFNPAFFQGGQGQMGASANATENWNPHGSKRARES